MHTGGAFSKNSNPASVYQSLDSLPLNHMEGMHYSYAPDP